MKKIFSFLRISIFFLLCLSLNPIFAQETDNDSTQFMQEVKESIRQNKFATAHSMLDARINQFGKKVDYICEMVENCLKNYYREENYDYYYLKDNDYGKFNKDQEENIKIARVRHPLRLLQWAVKRYPRDSLVYKLLGDFYDLQLKDYSDVKILEDDQLKKIEETVFKYYNQAEKLGYNDPYLNNWLGDYYLKNNQLQIAKTYYLKNVSGDAQNAISFYRLADIFYRKKQFTQANLFAEKAIVNFAPDEVYLKYDAILLAARSLFPIGEVDTYLEYLNECVQMLPGEQDAYIELAHYYAVNKDFDKADSIFATMLIKNPFDFPGYHALQQYVNKNNKSVFADSLFNTLSLKFESWDEVMANIYQAKGDIAFYQNKKLDAGKFWDISRGYMKKYLPEDGHLLKDIGKMGKTAGTN